MYCSAVQCIERLKRGYSKEGGEFANFEKPENILAFIGKRHALSFVKKILYSSIKRRIPCLFDMAACLTMAGGHKKERDREGNDYVVPTLRR